MNTFPTARFLPGDLVRTEYGLAIVTQITPTQGASCYAAWHLPGWECVKRSWGVEPPKTAWYHDEEFKLVSAGAASIIRAANT